MEAYEKEHLKKLAEDAFKAMEESAIYYGKDSKAAKYYEGEWFAYCKICDMFSIEYNI